MRVLRGDTLKIKELGLEHWIGKRRVYPHNDVIVREEIIDIEPFEVKVKVLFREDETIETFEYGTTSEMVEVLELLEYK
jgi:hypothetical protein